MVRFILSVIVQRSNSKGIGSIYYVVRLFIILSNESAAHVPKCTRYLKLRFCTLLIRQSLVPSTEWLSEYFKALKTIFPKEGEKF